MQKLCALCLLLLAATSTFAQIRSAVVIGAVTDPSGAAVPNAVIKLTNEETNVVSETKTNEAGLFTVPYLPAGRYSLDVAASGFNSYRQTGIVVSTAQTARSDVSLKVGAVETRVDVAASALQLQTESTSLGGSISENLIKNVPNMTQNPLFYATLQAGIVGRPQMMETQRADSFGIGQSSRQRFSAVNVNGANAFTNDIQLDGVSTQGSAWNEMTVLPNSEGIQEVRVTTNNFSAEYGRGQGIISFTTKSGTNEYHGSGFWRVRNEALNANTFSNNALGIPRAPFKPHNYGGTFGGPIKKNSLFFFVSWEGLRHRDAADWLLTVPTERERRGDFSQTFIRDQNGNPVRVGVFDPFNATQQGPDLWRRQPIPNSVIPNPDRGALHLFSFYPNPNRPAVDPVTGAQNFFQRNIRPFERNNINSRVDWRAGKHSIYGTAGTQRGSINAGRPFGADNPFYQPPSNGWTAQLNDDNNPYAAIGDTVVLSPTLLLDVRYGINRIASNSISPTPQPFDYGPLGIPSAYLPVMPLPGSAPDFGPGGNLSDLGNQSYQSKRERQTNHHIAGSMTKNLNRWTFKFGSEYRVMLSNYTDFQEAAFRINAPGWGGPGSYSSEFVTANGSGSPLNANPGQFGYDPANLFMGGGSINIAPGFPVRPAFAQKYFALYSQNDWRATNRLTINLGVRWDLQPGPTDRFNRTSSIDLNAANPFGGQGRIVFNGRDPGLSRNQWDTQWANFAPRVGAAFKLNDKTVLRGGFGTTFLPTNTGYYNGPFTYGMGTFSDFLNPLPYGQTPAGVPVGRWNSLAASPIVQGIGYDPTNPRVYGIGGYLFDRRDYRNGVSHMWNFTVERNVSRSMILTVAYAGNIGRDLQVSRQPLNTLQRLDDNVVAQWRQQTIASNGTLNPAFQQVANPFQPAGGPPRPFNGFLGQATVERWRTLAPWPLLGDMTMQRTYGFSNFNSLQISLRRSMANGLMFDAHYTWSKALDFSTNELQLNGFNNDQGGNLNFEIVDVRNLNNNIRYSPNDTPHRFVFNYLYELPFGKGKSLDANNRFVNAVIGGWRLGGIVIAQAGFPIAIGADAGLNRRPDRVAGVPIEVPGELQRWYDGRTTVTLPGGRQITPCANCFLKYNMEAFQGRTVTTPNGTVIPDPFFWGSSAMSFGDIRSPMLFNMDATLTRRFNVTERVGMELMANVTNVLNRANFRGGFQGWLGGINLVNNPAQGLRPGMFGNSNWGSMGMATFDPRQVQLQLRVFF